MIDLISGTLYRKTPTSVIVEVGGVGYFIKISLNTFHKFESYKEGRSSIKVITRFIVKEDSQMLYGFHDYSERDMFDKLISVSGVGANTAMIMLSQMTCQDLEKAIVSGNVAALTKIKGIGKKGAERIVLDLKDKFDNTDPTSVVYLDLSVAGTEEKISLFEKERDAIEALCALGMEKGKVVSAVKVILTLNKNISLEDIIKEYLKTK